MEAIQKTSQTPSNQGVPTPSGSSSQGGASPEFEQTLKGLLGPDSAKKVSEEELFSALVQERIKKTKGEAGLKEFQETLAKHKQSLQKPDGFVPLEQATKQALIEFRDAKKLTTEETDSLYSQCFAAAQLDGNTEALFDDRGGPNDPTMAVAAMEQALLLSNASIDKFDSGAATAPQRSVEEPTTNKATHVSSGTSAGDVGFLFKPISDSDGKLAVLLPPRLSGLVKSVTLVGPNGEILETGRYAGNGNGGREHFRFSKPGGQYPDGLTVEVTLATSELVKYFIRETSERDEQGTATTSPSPTTPSKDEKSTPSQGDSSAGDTSL